MSCTAGYKAMWSKEGGFPSDDYFAALDPAFADVVDAKMSRTLASLGDRAGGLSDRAAALTGLRPGTPSLSRTSMRMSQRPRSR